MSTILDIKRLLLQICMCIHGPRGPRQKISGLLSSAQLFTLDKERYASIKRHEPLFLSQIRTEITEGNKITYPFLEQNLNVLLVGSSNDNTYNEQTFDDQVIEYFLILVKE